MSYPEWSQNDLVRCSRFRHSQQWTLITDNKDYKSIRAVTSSGPCTPLAAEILSAFSPIRNLKAVVRESGGHQLLEIWDCHGRRKCLDLTALNKHGQIYDDAQFGCLSWSECENKLLYVAEKSKSTTEGENVYRDDWGEGLTTKSNPVICVVNLQNGNVHVLQGVEPGVSPGQALWAPGSQSVFFIGWYHEPFRLGLKFCSNRRSALFKLDLEGHCECLSGENLSVSCPRLSPDGSTLIYLQGQVFGPHHQCLSLQQVDSLCLSVSTLLDVVHRPEPGECAGIYETLPSSCWSADSQKVVFSSACRNWKDLFIVDRGSKKVTSLSDSKLYGSWKLLTIQRDLMVVCCSSPNTPPTLVRLSHTHTHITHRQSFCKQICHVTYHMYVFAQRVGFLPPAAGLDFAAVLVKPNLPLQSSVPLVVFIHGLFNYRGSTGFGQDGILSLIGQIGHQDVKDVQRAVVTALNSDPALDPKRLAVIGGSHGGFLSCHLIGQYPDFYRACAVRNPVINAATLLGTSDIVDWRYTSVGLHFSYDHIPTADDLAVMLEKSPIRHAAQIKAPVLLMLGGRDRRVSPHQGLELYKVLKSRASPVRLLWFAEDGHSLSRVDTQVNCFLNTVLWLYQHL
uniref:acylaminoacyl-peptidase n=1 Tax=Cynoglossus semilaevis TaxID=244447 RepID=A0A3P8V6W7_CYNSE